METQTQNLERVPESSSFSIQTFDHAQRVAKMLSSSSLIPKEFQGNIQNTMIALEMANRIGASPLMVMQNLYIVHGKPSWSSTFIIASINSCGRFRPLRFDVTGSGMDLSCVAWSVEKDVVIPSNIRTLAEARAASLPTLESPMITMTMAKAEGWIDKNGSKWKTMPELMIRYRAAAFFGRLYAPEIMMGMQTSEEVVDITPMIIEPEEITVEELNALIELTMPALTADEFEDAKRIVETKDEKSFRKLKKFLTDKHE